MIDLNRLLSELNEVAAIGAEPHGGVRRPAFSDAEGRARHLLTERMTGAGLRVVEDSAGNIIGRLEGEGAAVIAGSHIDSVEGGGRYDGVLGVFGALECIRTMRENGVRTRRPIEVVAFSDEEERFHGFLGSYAFTGRIAYEDIKNATDGAGVRLERAMHDRGLDPTSMHTAKRAREEIHAFIELHVEQGPILDREGVPIGIVESVKGDYRYNLRIEGRGDHAGAPAEGRRDAFMIMHRLLGAVLQRLAEYGDPEMTCTVGRMRLVPNIETVQPGVVEHSLDLRSIDQTALENAERGLRYLAEQLERELCARITVTRTLVEQPLQFDAGVIETIRAAASALGYRWRYIASGAGHDGQVLGRYAPAAMIFVPSVDGRSHCAEEYTRPEDIERGVNVLYRTLVRLAQ